MTRIHDDSAVAKRSNISLAILIAAFAYGIWEFWHVATVSGDMGGYFFGFAFVGGAIYGLRTTLKEARDLVFAFDADLSTGHAMISLWRPLGNKRIKTSLDRITGWRHWIQSGTRGRRNYFLLAQEPSHDGALRFELRPGVEIAKEMRKLAPEAIADFEREVKSRASQ
jgi:hypothetical protein